MCGLHVSNIYGLDAELYVHRLTPAEYRHTTGRACVTTLTYTHTHTPHIHARPHTHATHTYTCKHTAHQHNPHPSLHKPPVLHSELTTCDPKRSIIWCTAIHCKPIAFGQHVCMLLTDLSLCIPLRLLAMLMSSFC